MTANGNGNGNGGLAGGRIVQTIVALIALSCALASVILPIKYAIDALREDLVRVEESAAAARTSLRDDLREAISHADQRLQVGIDSHNSWALQRNSEIEAFISELRERTRAVEAALVENETQHKWIADVFNSMRSTIDQRTRAYWDGTKIVYPDENDTVLESIGEARKNGNGHK